MKILSFFGWMLYKCIINLKRIALVVGILYIMALLCACGSSKKTEGIDIAKEQTIKADSFFSHTKDYFDNSTTTTDESSTKTVTEYTAPVITKDSAGNTVITATKIVTTEEKKQKKVVDQKAITILEKTVVKTNLIITVKEQLHITKTITITTKGWFFHGIGVGVLGAIFLPFFFKKGLTRIGL